MRKRIISMLLAGILIFSNANIDLLAASSDNSDSIKETKELADSVSITLNKTEVTILEGEQVSLTAQCSPSETEGVQSVSWSSSNENVVIVDSNGNVSAIKSGTATITAKTGEATATCDVLVRSANWVCDNIGWWYRNDNGTYPYSCWKIVDDSWYYFDRSGYCLTGWQVVGESWYYFDSEIGAMASNEWIGDYYVSSSGVMAKEWLKLAEGWYYLGASGLKQTGWINVGGTWYYGGTTGLLYEKEWLNDTYYFLSGGVMATGWTLIGGDYYYFTTDGAKATNCWIGSYYLKSNGVMAVSEWVENGKYYVDARGVYVTGWLNLGEKWYYLNASGAKQAGWMYLGGVWYYGDLQSGALLEKEWLNDTYYFYSGGAMATGWVLIDGEYYYFEASGAKVVNRWIGDYYLKADGMMAKAEWIGNYYVDESGAWVPEAKSKLVSSVTLNKSKVVLAKEQKETLVATVLPKRAENKKIVWSSSDKNIATVDENGTVTAINVGTVTITAATVDGSNIKAEAKVRVTGVLVKTVDVSPKNSSVKEGFSTQLSVTVGNEDADNKNVNWISSNEDIAIVDKKGTVIAKADGTVTITAIAADGSGVYDEAVVQITNNDDFEYTAYENHVVLEGYLSNSTTMVIPEYLDGKIVDEIGNSAFDENVIITDIVFSENLKTINYRAFNDCDNLTNVVVPDTVTGVLDSWFTKCDNLAKIEIGSGITRIESDSFYGLEKLKTVEFSEGLQYIGSYAFNGTGITELNIPSTIKTIDAFAFADCDAFTEIVVPDTVEGTLECWFRQCDNLEKVKIGSGITLINGYSFLGLENLKEVEFSEGLTIIGQSAFQGTGITELNIPSTVKTIESDAFNDCDGLTEVVIPDTVEGEINFVFYRCDNLQRIKIGAGITSVNGYSFSGLSNLKEVEFSEGLTYIGTEAFSGAGIEELNIPSTVKTIESTAFRNCDGLTEVVIPDTVEGEINFVFDDCDNLQKIKIGAGITSVNGYSFSGLSNLKEVEFSEGLTYIGTEAFSGTGITEIHIPSTVKTIGYDAFDDCNNLMKYYFYGNELTFEDGALANNKDAIAYYNITNADWSEIIATYDNIIWIPFDGGEVKDIIVSSMNSIENMYVGDSIEVFVTLNSAINKAEIEDSFSFNIDDESVVKYSVVQSDKYGTTLKLTALKEGKVLLTIRSSLNNEIAYKSITVGPNLLTLSADELPEYDDYGEKYNFYVSGMYVADFAKVQNSDGSYNVSMNVFNSTYVCGAVDVYDKDGNFKQSVKIDKHTRGGITSLGNTFNAVCFIAQDIASGRLLTYKNSSSSTETPVLVTVPEGGYIEITNSVNASENCMIYNMIEIVAFSISIGIDVVSYDHEKEQITDSLIVSLTETLSEENIKEQFVDSMLDVMESAMVDEITINNGNDIMLNFSKEIYGVMKTVGVDWKEIGKNVAAEMPFSYAEGIVTDVLGFAGKALEFVFKLQEYSDFILQNVQMRKSLNGRIIRVTMQ